MKKYLACALLAIGLTLNVEAQTTTLTTYSRPATVPDNGSTAVLLGFGFLTLAALHRKIARA